MNFTLLAVLCVAVTTTSACSAERVKQPPPPPVQWSSLSPRPPRSAEPPKASGKERMVAGAYAKALESPGFATLGPLLDDDAHFTYAGHRDAYGRANVVKAYDALLGAFDQRSVTTSRVWLTDNAQAVEWVLSGVHARDWARVAATRKTVSVRGITLLWTKDDGAIADSHVYFDEALLKATLGAGPKGLVPPPPAAPTAAARQEFEQCHTPEEASNVAAVRASLEALEKSDESAYLATLTDDLEVNTLEHAPAHGKADARAYFKAMHKSVAQLDTTVDNVYGAGSFVIVEYFVVGEQTGPLGWVPAQRDALLKLSFVDVVELHAGKIARVWRYDDPAQVLSP